jgi:hypothetical protein
MENVLKKIAYATIISILTFNICFSQAYLSKGSKIWSQNDSWFTISEADCFLNYTNGKIKVPIMSGVYFNKDGSVYVVHFPSVKGDNVAKLNYKGGSYSINGISFFHNGEVSALWFNEPYKIQNDSSIDKNISYPCGIQYCVLDPFGRGSIDFNIDGSINSIFIDGTYNFEYNKNNYLISDFIMFHRSGNISSIRFKEPLQFETPLGKFYAATAGFTDNGLLNFITIQQCELIIKKGKYKFGKSIDFHPNGSLYVSYLLDTLIFDDIDYKNKWIGFDDLGNFIGEMEFDENKNIWIAIH